MTFLLVSIVWQGGCFQQTREAWEERRKKNPLAPGTLNFSGVSSCFCNPPRFLEASCVWWETLYPLSKQLSCFWLSKNLLTALSGKGIRWCWYKGRASERGDSVAACCSGLWCPATAVSHTAGKMRTVWQSKGKHNAASSPESKMIGLDQRNAPFLRFEKEKTENKC